MAAITRYKLSIRLSCHHASNRHCSRCPEVIGKVIAASPPSRDIDDDAMRVRKLPVPNTHAFSSSEVNVEPEETTNDQTATA